MKWIKTSERLPEKSMQCLCYKKYIWNRRGVEGAFYQTEILAFNNVHNCWDNEDGDDYNCDIETVTHWMPLPEPPKE